MGLASITHQGTPPPESFSACPDWATEWRSPHVNLASTHLTCAIFGPLEGFGGTCSANGLHKWANFPIVSTNDGPYNLKWGDGVPRVTKISDP